MMHTPPCASVTSSAYPIGDTPAVCLTKDFPYEEKANILILGCGDARSVLFTTFADNKFDREFDITCCDNQEIVIARNVLLYTLLLDDKGGANNTAIWDIYYDLFLDDASFEFVNVQAKKLHALATSLPAWHASKYGKILRFCDQVSLKKVRGVWEDLSISDLTESERDGYDQEFRAHIERSIPTGGDDTVTSIAMKLHSLRSIAPADMDRMDEVFDLYKEYWYYGTTDEDLTKIAAAVHSNPMFACLTVNKSLNYSSRNPFLGFHLANSFIPLSRSSPLLSKSDTGSSHSKILATARLQFKLWSAAFQKCADRRITLRFFIGDALAFCNVLEYKLSSTKATSANLYRQAYSFKTLVLDGEDYSHGGQAPLSFDVIDSSNLGDQIGAINVLTAASPLLIRRLSSTLYTETTLKHTLTHKELIYNSVCGDLPSIAVLFGLFPLQYYNNASAVSIADEGLSEVHSSTIRTSPERLRYSRLVWKCALPGCSKIGFDDTQLAILLYKTYQEMFRGENLISVAKQKDSESRRCHEAPTYHRGSFAALLRVVKAHVRVDWDKFMTILIRLIFTDRTLGLTRNICAELTSQLHIRGLHTTVTLTKPYIDQMISTIPKGGFVGWSNMPPILCVTLKVPRSNLEELTRKLPSGQFSTPAVKCTLTAPTGVEPMSNISTLQMTFGTILTSGKRDSPNFKVLVSEDESMWFGDSPLIVSFYTPTMMLIGNQSLGDVSFAIQPSWQNIDVFDPLIGRDKILFNSTLANRGNVYITTHPPGQSGYPFTPRCLDPNSTKKRKSTSVSISAQVDPTDARIVSFTSRIDFISEGKKKLLERGMLRISQASPCSLAVLLSLPNNTGSSYKLKFPVPMLQVQSECPISDRSSYVKATVRIDKYSKGMGSHGFMYPYILRKNGPVLVNMPYIDLQQLPIADITKHEDLKWFASQLFFQLSYRERAVEFDSKRFLLPEHARNQFKRTLHTIFVGFYGVTHRRRIDIFAICSADRHCPHFLLYPSALRLDMDNRTMVLDAAVLPITDEFLDKHNNIIKVLMKLKTIRRIPVTNEELEMWQNALPGWVERCRDWKHTASCEYQAMGLVPLSHMKGTSPICSCGNGKMPDKFITRTPKWGMVSKHAVRVGITACFPVPYVDPAFAEGQTIYSQLQHMPSCPICGSNRPPRQGRKLISCKCLQTYCSTECRDADFPEHKKQCIGLFATLLEILGRSFRPEMENRESSAL